MSTSNWLCSRLQVSRVHAIHGPHEVVFVMGVGHRTELSIDFTPKSLDEDILHPVFIFEGHWLFLVSHPNKISLGLGQF